MEEREVRRRSKRRRIGIERCMGTKRRIERKKRIESKRVFVEEKGRRGKESDVEME